MSPFLEPVRRLAAEFSLSRHEAQRDLGPMMAEALVSHGYAREQDDRLAVTEKGRKLLRMEGANADASV